MSIKKFSVGAWITCAATLISLVALIIYSINIAGEGYFQGRSVKGLVLWSILAILMLLIAIVLRQVKADGAAASVLELVSGAMQIGAVVLLALSLINLIAGRVEGLGFIYFSNADVSKEVQTPANMSSASGSIASMAAFGVSLILSTVAAFCSLKKKEK